MILAVPLLILSISTSVFGSIPTNAPVFARATRAARQLASASSAASRTTTKSVASSTLSVGSATVSALATAVPTGKVPMSPLASLATIGTATTSEVTQALPSTYAAGSTGPVKGAPPLPAITGISPANYPPLDLHAPANSAQVLQWISEINLAGAPNIPPTGINGCQNATYNAAAIANATSNGNCWWTCGGCTRATDITFCPTKNTWGLSYDDGPSPYTPRLLNFLAQNLIKTTFFIVGSRAISRPQTLQTEYMQGHQLSVHTWSHPPLTTLTNEQIVAELGWTKKIIKEVTGVTPNTMRPPYGDIDDRVRYISLQMGLTPIIWTAYGGNTFDTRDWQIGAGVVNSTSVYMNFENFLGTATTTLATGFVVLAHDLYQQSVELAVNYVLPSVINAGVLKLQPIISCLGFDLSQAYIETADNSTVPPARVTSTLVGASGIGFVAGVTATSVTAAAAQLSSANAQFSSQGLSTAATTTSAPTSTRAATASASKIVSAGMLMAISMGLLAVVV